MFELLTSSATNNVGMDFRLTLPQSQLLTHCIVVTNLLCKQTNNKIMQLGLEVWSWPTTPQKGPSVNGCKVVGNVNETCLKAWCVILCRPEIGDNCQ